MPTVEGRARMGVALQRGLRSPGTGAVAGLHSSSGGLQSKKRRQLAACVSDALDAPY